MLRERVVGKKPVRVIQLERNLGFAAAVNRGVEASQSDWIAILNNDVTLAPDWLQVLLEAALREDAWFATGKILSAEHPSILDGAFDEVSRGACAARCGAGQSDGAVWNLPRQIRFAPMTAALFRSSLFHEVGGLDEDFGSYMEDVEFGIRCALAGRTREPTCLGLSLITRAAPPWANGARMLCGAFRETNFCWF